MEIVEPVFVSPSKIHQTQFSNTSQKSPKKKHVFFFMKETYIKHTFSHPQDASQLFEGSVFFFQLFFSGGFLQEIVFPYCQIHRAKLCRKQCFPMARYIGPNYGTLILSCKVKLPKTKHPRCFQAKDIEEKDQDYFRLSKDPKV